MTSSSDEEELLLLLLALSCKRQRRRCWMLRLFSQGSCIPGDLYKNKYSRTFSINFSADSSAIPYCPPRKSVSKTQMSAARRDPDLSAASARLLFDGDDAILHNTVRTPSRRGHRSLPAAAARFLCDRTLSI